MFFCDDSPHLPSLWETTSKPTNRPSSRIEQVENQLRLPSASIIQSAAPCLWRIRDKEIERQGDNYLPQGDRASEELCVSQGEQKSGNPAMKAIGLQN